MRVGFGYDIHRLVKGRPLVLGGVEIPSETGEEGFSDGDVLIHALIDALLGAAGLGDIGRHFPPGDPRYRNISSRRLLRETARLLEENHFQIVNIDCTVILEKPRILPYSDAVKKNLSGDLTLPVQRISVKAKTKEGADETGKGTAVEAYAVALLSLP